MCEIVKMSYFWKHKDFEEWAKNNQFYRVFFGQKARFLSVELPKNFIKRQISTSFGAEHVKLVKMSSAATSQARKTVIYTKIPSFTMISS